MLKAKLRSRTNTPGLHRTDERSSAMGLDAPVGADSLGGADGGDLCCFDPGEFARGLMRS